MMLETNDGDVLAGISSDPVLISMIVSYVAFVRVDESRFTAFSLKDIAKRGGAE